MADHDDSDYEERLRRVLRQVPSPRADADDILARVESGARRRVRRRRVGGAVASVAAATVAAAVIVPNVGQESNVASDPDGVRTTHPEKRLHGTELHKRRSAEYYGKRPHSKATAGKAELSAGQTTEATDVAVSDFAVSDSGNLSLLGEGSCPDGPCYVTGSTASSEYRVAPSHDRLLQPMNATATATAGTKPGIRVGSDESNSWTWTDSLYATHDSGKTWKPAKLPGSFSVQDVESGGGRVWAFGTRPNGRAAVASSSEQTDDWVAESVPVSSLEAIQTPMVVGDEVAFVAVDRNTRRTTFVRQRGGDWTRNPLPCVRPVESSTSDDTIWLGCHTPRGMGKVIWSQDDGETWRSLPFEVPDLTAIGGVDADTAVAGAGERLAVVDAKRSTFNQTSPPFSGNDAKAWDGSAGYTAIRFDDDGTGYATTTGGALARSDDGGATWKAETLP